MCRLYGFRANEPTKVECSLVHAQNALLSQSVCDARGVPNADGWGIGYYSDGQPQIERRHTAAHADQHFSLAAERVYAMSVLAHVRATTVGATGPGNTHPFVHGHWTFAHNGTVHGFARLEARLTAETDPDLRALRRGTTDSETAFYWLLTRMRRAGLDIDAADVALDVLLAVLGRAVADLDALCAQVAPDEPAQLNFLLINGHVMVATRLRNSLYLIERHGVHDCEICGIPHIVHDARTGYRAVAIASEQITDEAWREVPEASLVAVNAALDVDVRPLAVATPV